MSRGHKHFISGKSLLRYWWLIPIVILAVSGISAYLLLGSVRTSTQLDANGIPECAEANRDDFACWEKRYQKMVEQRNPVDALTEAKTLYDTVSIIKTQCHQIAHVIGRAGGKKYNDVAVAFQNGNDFCSSGYYHGVMEHMAVAIGTDNIKDKVTTICDSIRRAREYSLAHHNCTHGLGHGLMAITEDNLFESLKLCDQLEGGWQQDSCGGGVFMENIMYAINTKSRSTTYLRPDDPMYPCTDVEFRYRSSCFLTQTAYPLNVLGKSYQEVFALCDEIAAPHDAVCYQSMGRDISGNALEQKDLILERCMYGADYDAKNNCFIGAVKDVVWYFNKLEPGMELCAGIADASMRQSCESTATGYYGSF